MRSIKQIHKAQSAPIDDLITYRAMPIHGLSHLDPFIFLNHHGPQQFGPNNKGLPFGPHPHRGFETLTYVIKGDIVHWDSSGSKSVIKEGGVQWMTAGRGLIHSEVSSEEFKEKGGEEEVLQLWLNLSSKNKMVNPIYHGLTKADITHFTLNNEKVNVHLISGQWNEHIGPLQSLENLSMMSIEMEAESSFRIDIPREHQILFYIVKGSVEVNGQSAKKLELVEFDKDGEKLSVKALENTYLILGHGKPLNEPIVAQGPFVMNTREELAQAFDDYRAGKMGSWES